MHRSARIQTAASAAVVPAAVLGPHPAAAATLDTTPSRSRRARRKRPVMRHGKTRGKIRTVMTLLAVSALTALAAAFPAGAAHAAHTAADSPLVACPGWVEQTIHPGLTLLPANNTVKVSGTFGPCVNQIIDPDHAFAEYTASASGLISCTVNAPITNATGTVKWQNQAGQHTGTSHFTGGITISQRPVGETVGIVVATITSGDFTGRTLQLTSARLTIDPVQCVTSGIRRVAGPGSLAILPV